MIAMSRTVGMGLARILRRDRFLNHPWWTLKNVGQLKARSIIWHEMLFTARSKWIMILMSLKNV
eukprot:633021-Prorocentrum_lima.AAC.1